ncbi:ABC transporter permease [Clostridium ihumii]|uniref:ABC transporter permease n=1 Tax=Clostridium ihumii TaxID=1470356 RepID=UPI00058B96C0|nr:ABC transporter permease [Clostridium ihumii]
MSFWVLFKNNMKRMIQKQTGTFAISIIMPVIILIVSVKYFTIGEWGLKTVINDKDNTTTSKIIVEQINNIEGLSIKDIKEENIDEFIENYDLDLCITIPKGFENAIIMDDDSEVIFKQGKNSEISSGIKEKLNIEINNIRKLSTVSNKNDELYKDTLKKYDNGIVSIEGLNLKDLRANHHISRFFITIVTMFIFYRGLYGAKLMVEDKESEVYTRIFSGSVTSTEYYLANICSTLVVMIIQILICLICLNTLVNIDAGLKCWELFIILLVVAISAVSVGIVCFSISGDIQGSGMIFNVVSMGILALGGWFLPSSFFPKFINKISYFIPTRWTMDALLDLQQGAKFSNITLNLLIDILFALALFTIAAYKTAKKEKIYKDL